MLFLRKNPSPDLAHLIKEFWIFENPEVAPEIQKVIPDGYCEIIIHYGDLFRIKLYDSWELQDRILFSGQIRQFFHLENTGRASMLGIKLMPAAPYLLFGREMQEYTDRVVPLAGIVRAGLPGGLTDGSCAWDQRVVSAEQWLRSFIDTQDMSTRIAPAIQHIFETNGMVDIGTVAEALPMTRRHLEREFKRVVGLTPKYFARIIQFSFIFAAMKQDDNGWVDVALNSGYFDQSHFIRNFKAFTGESPSQYGFDEENMANFFLRK